MSLWEASTITRFSQEAEEHFADDYPCILKRVSLTITANQNLYTIPDDVRSIRRITWLGTKLDPLGQRNMREVFQNATQVGTPFWYVFNNLGANVIQLFPCPGISVNPSGNNLYNEGILTDVILEYFAMPNFTTYTIPQYFRQRLLKAYVLKMCFTIEGPGQNLKNAQYWNKRWLMLKDKYGMLLESLHNRPRKLSINGINGSQFFPGQPVLPISRFGVSVSEGE